MKLEDIEAFLNVAELGGFSRAAVHTRVAQSALSRRIARLEHQLGVQLFERRARGVQLTENGAVLFQRARGLAHQLDDIEKEVRELSSAPQGEVRIAMPPMTVTILAPLVARDICERFPGIRLSILEGSSGQIHSWILSGDVDVALLYNPEESAELEITSVVKAPLFLVVPSKAPPALKAAIAAGMTPDGRFRFKAIGSIPLIMPSPLHGVRKLVERMAVEHRVSTNVVIEADGLGVAVSLAREGLGCAIFSHAAENERFLKDRLQLVPFSPPLNWTLAVVSKADPKPRRAMVVARQFMQKHLHELISDGLWAERPQPASGAATS